MPVRVRAIVASDNKDKCKELAALELSDTDIATAERLPVGVDGVEPVDDADRLVRVIENPTHVKLDDPATRLTLACSPAAFGDAYNKGLSVQRLSMTTADQVETFGKARAAERGRDYLGFIGCSAADLRASYSEFQSRRLLSVFATPLEESEAHADVCVHLRPTRSDKEYLKFFFWDTFKGEPFLRRVLQEIDAANQPTA